MALDTRGYGPSREGAKDKILKEIIQYLDSRIGEGLKSGGSVHLDVVKKDESDGEVSPEDLADPLAGDDPGAEDDDEAKLLALARKRR